MAALIFVLDALVTLVVIAFLLRLLLPMVRADLRNPIGQAVLKVTNPVVMPLRRLLGSAGRIDLASLAALLLVQVAGTAALRLVAGGGLAPPLPVLVRALHDLAQAVLQFYFVAVLLYALLSWIGPASHGAAAHLLGRLCEPLLSPVRRLVPPIGGLDLSALFVLIGLQALQILLH
jgi:YggT family protein